MKKNSLLIGTITAGLLTMISGTAPAQGPDTGQVSPFPENRDSYGPRDANAPRSGDAQSQDRSGTSSNQDTTSSQQTQPQGTSGAAAQQGASDAAAQNTGWMEKLDPQMREILTRRSS
jgi:hypothetical protein